MSRPVDVAERVGQWFAAYQAVSEQLTPQEMRNVLAKMDMTEGVAQLGSYMSLARNVMANDRAAATVAAMLVSSGIRPAPMSFEEEG